MRHITVNALVLNGQVNKYTFVGLILSLASIFIASAVVSFQLTGLVTLEGLTQAQLTNPAIWALDLTPFMFAYWGQSYCYSIAKTANSILTTTTDTYKREKKKLKDELIYEKTVDKITELPNYNLLLERINKEIQKEQSQFLLVVLKVNELNEIKEQLGDHYANTLLKQLAKELKEMLLEVFILKSHNGKSFVARMRKDEFTIVLSGLSTEHSVDDILTFINKYTSKNRTLDEISFNTTTTLGAALYPNQGSSAKKLMKHATESVTLASQHGQAFAYITQPIEHNENLNHQLLAKLTEAINEKEYNTVFLPYFDLATQTVVGLEAQINFVDETLNNFSKNELLYLEIEFESLKKILFEAVTVLVKELAALNKSGQTLFGKIDLSLIDCRSNDFIKHLTYELEKNKLDPSSIILSLDEKKLARQPYLSLEEFSKLETQIAIDNFTNTLSPFSSLKKLSIQNVQIPHQFLNDIEHSENNRLAIKGLVKLAKLYNINVFANHIITSDALNTLKELGVTIGSGSYLSTALNPQKLRNLLN